MGPVLRMSAAATALLLMLSSLPQSAPARDVRVEITPEEIRIIREYYAGKAEHDHEARSGAKGRGRGPGGLPPGIAKNLARGKPLPPGIAKQHLPDTLKRELPAPPKGYERVIVDGKVLLVEIATEVIRDVLTDAIVY